VARKGFGLSPKEDKSGLGFSKEDGCSLSSTVDGSGVWQVLSELFTYFMSSLVCRLCYVHCRTQCYHVDIFLFPVSMSHVDFRF
jgi:hypothetical protein